MHTHVWVADEKALVLLSQRRDLRRYSRILQTFAAAAQTRLPTPLGYNKIINLTLIYMSSKGEAAAQYCYRKELTRCNCCIGFH